LETERKERQEIADRYEKLTAELTKKGQELEQKEKERIEQQSRCDSLWRKIETTESECKFLRDDRDSLRDQIQALKDELRQMEDAKRQMEDAKRDVIRKLEEREQLIRRVEEENAKLENRLYHEERRLNATITSLREQISKSQSFVANHSALGDVVNTSGNSSDRDFLGHLSSDVPTLWSDVEGSEVMASRMNDVKRDLRKTVRDTNTASPREYNGGSTLPRRLPKDAVLAEGRTRRMRSRSAGRQTGRTSAHRLNNGNDFPTSFYDDGQFDRPMSARHSKSGNVYYSSDGSNGARSPPPELPLVSGVPPPGLIKRPTTVTPNFHVQIHKPK
jgi:hypothetical protein